MGSIILDEKAQLFEEHRRLLEGIAYRMLGTVEDARDVVQDTYLKWWKTSADEIENPRAWLVKVCSRLALNAVSTARARRESYFGVWLPEPLVKTSENDVNAQTERDETVSIALLLALEKVSPAERAAFLLHEVFDYSFEEIAEILGRTNAGCRQLAARARRRLRGDRPRFLASVEEHRDLLDAFLEAARNGNIARLQALLAHDVELYSDGGGKASAPQLPLLGVDLVSAFFVQVWQQIAQENTEIAVTHCWFNGSPGLLILQNMRLTTAITLESTKGRITRIYAIRNPDKLTAFAG